MDLITAAVDLINKFTEERRQDLWGRLGSLESDHQSRLAEALHNLEGITKLREEGFNVSVDQWAIVYGPYLKVDVKDLPKLYKTIGKLTLSGKHLSDSKKREVTVSLKSVRYPSFSISYKKTLPKGNASKCRIVKKRVYESQLVCEA